MSRGSKQSEWMDWFDQFDTDESIRVAACRPIVPVHGLGLLTIGEACQKLDKTLRAVFVPGPQHVEILRGLLDQARGFARVTYPTVTDYNRLRCSAKQESADPQQIRCLTGLGGVSKSSLVEAFERICRLQPSAEFQTNSQRLLIYPVRRVVIDGKPAVRCILKGMANQFALSGRAMNEMGDLMEHVKDWFLATATSTLVVDEMQFFTQSSSASAKTSQLIMTLANLGTPLVYVANYSLVRKLMQRPQEEKDRLLAAPTVLNPPAADDPWWIATVEQYISASPGVFRLDAGIHARDLHRYTAGLFRALRELLKQAYREAREQGRDIVGLDDVRSAYRSRSYSSHRKDVEDLASLAVSNSIAEKRPDLVCPFAEVQLGGRTSATNLAFSQRTAPAVLPSAALIESSISREAKVTLRDLRRAADLPPEERTTAKVTRLARRPQVSAQTLSQGAQALRDALNHKRPATEKSLQVESSDDKTT